MFTIILHNLFLFGKKKFENFNIFENNVISVQIGQGTKVYIQVYT
jgi:hypothetical protein